MYPAKPGGQDGANKSQLSRVNSPDDYGRLGVRALRVGLVSIFCVALTFYVVKSIHWAMMIDSPVIHYVNFLMAHGMKPYSQITDMNMPGSYLLDSFEMHVFGTGDLALRIYSYFLALVLVGAMVVITWQKDWMAGFYAGGFFVFLQAAEGPKTAVEREQVLVTLIMLGCAFLFIAVRTEKPVLTFLFGFLAGLAPTIKPTTILLPLALLTLLFLEMRRRRTPAGKYVLWALCGMVAAGGTSVLFLAHYQAFGSLWFMIHTQLPSYVSMKHPPLNDMIRTFLPIPVLIPLGLATLAFACSTNRRKDWDWERWAIAAGVAAGTISYFGQNKGFLHHRYMFLCFLLLLIGLELTSALNKTGVARLAGAAGLLFSALFAVPRYLQFVAKVPTSSPYTIQLERDLDALGGKKLDHRVLCLDLVFGCLNALYHLEIVENGGYTGDLLLFSPVDTEGTLYYRRYFTAQQLREPADVLVVSNEWLEHPNTFSRLDTWPQFRDYLDQNYSLQLARSFPEEGSHSAGGSEPGAEPQAYRIYARKN